MSEWKTSCCALCSTNCGIKVQLGGKDGREIIRTKGDKEHPVSKGYLCNKASRLNYYLNPEDRLQSPMKRNESGGYDAIDWDTAIAEIASKLTGIRDTLGGDKIFYYGGGGQGNHTPGLYSRATNSVLGVKYRSNALAQEKTGEFWVCNRMFGGWNHPDFEHCDLAIFIGKNPWHSHGFQRARAQLRDIKNDPNRKMIVIDPKRTETADMADIHLAVKPGRDAWLLAAIAATIIQNGLFDKSFMETRVKGYEELFSAIKEIDVDAYAQICGVDCVQIRKCAELISASERVAVLEDLGIQMNRHSTLASYLQRIIWVVTGNYGRAGTNNIPHGLGAIGSGQGVGKTPVTKAPIITGLIPCNSIPEEILTDHPDRFRAMIIESANPVHSLADSESFRQAMAKLDFTVVIDVAMTETARQADYVLPTANQYEKAEASFFNFEFPKNFFQLRHPLFDAPEGLLSEGEIHSRLVEAMGAVPQSLVDQLDNALDDGLSAFQKQVFSALAEDPSNMNIATTLLYRTLGKRLGKGMEQAAGLWMLAQDKAARMPQAVERAGIKDQGEGLGNALFNAIIENESGLIVSCETYEDSWKRLGKEERINLDNPELVAELGLLKTDKPVDTSMEFPFLLAAGERRSFTANTILRNPDWRKKDAEGALLIHPDDAARLNLGSGSMATVTTKKGGVDVIVELSDRMMRGLVSLPNGMGLEYPDENGELAIKGVSLNELTSLDDRDKFVGTPWHKSIPARIEAI